MLPSEELRLEIEKKYGIDLKQYAWSEELKQQIFSIPLDKSLETNADTLGEIYSHGFNIGHCGLTSRYIARGFSKANLYYGKAALLVGTKSAPNGEHAWTILNDQIIDTTLMISIPTSIAKTLGYIQEKEIAPISARMLSEYEVYDNEFKLDQLNEKYKKVK